MQQVGALVKHFLDGREIAAALAFDHVARERERAAGKPDQRHAAGQRAPHLTNRIQDVAQMRCRDRARPNRGFPIRRAAAARISGLRRPRNRVRGPSRREWSGYRKTRSPRRAAKRASGCSVTSVARSGFLHNARKLPARARVWLYSGK